MKKKNKKPVAPTVVFFVAWVPMLKIKPLTEKAVLDVGGRIISNELNKTGADEVMRCLEIGTLLLDGEYIAVSYPLETEEIIND